MKNHTSTSKIKALLIICLAAILLPMLSYAAPQSNRFIVVIDAGHGGHDPGAVGNGVQEKDINLAVAKKLGELLENKLKAIVIYTRSDDNFVELADRAKKANQNGANLFISIHTNSLDPSSPNYLTAAGSETFVFGEDKDHKNMDLVNRENNVSSLTSDDNEVEILTSLIQLDDQKNSRILASAIQKELKDIGRIDRGVKEAGFAVLKNTAMPSVLIELDFITNPESAKFLSEKKGQEKLAKAIFNAVKTYRDYYNKNHKEKAKAAKGSSVEGYSDADRERFLADLNTPSSSEETVELASAAPEEIKRHRNKDTQVSTAAEPKRRTARRTKNKNQSQSKRILNTADYSELDDDNNTLNFDDMPVKKEDKQVAQAGSNLNQGSYADRKENAGKPGRRDKNERNKVRRQHVAEVYQILLFTSKEFYESEKDPAYKGLTDVTYVKDGDTYKYYYGNSTDRLEMESLLVKVKEKFPKAKIVKQKH